MWVWKCVIYPLRAEAQQTWVCLSGAGPKYVGERHGWVVGAADTVDSAPATLSSFFRFSIKPLGRNWPPFKGRGFRNNLRNSATGAESWWASVKQPVSQGKAPAVSHSGEQVPWTSFSKAESEI